MELRCSQATTVLTKIKADDPMFIPQYQSNGAVCADLIANVPPDFTKQRQVTIMPNRCVMIDCGFSMELPIGYKAEITVRSGHAKAMLFVPNSPGQIDQDFRGRVMVLMANLSKVPMVVIHGERFAQISVSPFWKFEWNPVTELEDTMRNSGGFGSTGKI